MFNKQKGFNACRAITRMVYVIGCSTYERELFESFHFKDEQRQENRTRRTNCSSDTVGGDETSFKMIYNFNKKSPLLSLQFQHKMDVLQICTFALTTKIEAKLHSSVETFIGRLKVDEIHFKMMCNLLKKNYYFPCYFNLNMKEFQICTFVFEIKIEVKNEKFHKHIYRSLKSR